MELQKNIDQYRYGSMIDFEKVCSIPVPDRIPGLIEKYGFEKMHAVLVVMLTDFCNYYNVIRPMGPDQIILCAFEILNSSKEDYLSVEDLSIFFSGAKMGKYGRVLDHLDQHVIFEMLENYREQRHREYIRLKESKHLEYKGLGPSEKVTQNNPLEESFYNMAGRLNDLKDRLKEQREINRSNRL